MHEGFFKESKVVCRNHSYAKRKLSDMKQNLRTSGRFEKWEHPYILMHYEIMFLEQKHEKFAYYIPTKSNKIVIIKGEKAGFREPSEVFELAHLTFQEELYPIELKWE
jgi:hypothetical protein